jgi:hypothetical protein
MCNQKIFLLVTVVLVVTANLSSSGRGAGDSNDVLDPN